MGYTEVEETVKSQATGRRSSSPEPGSLPLRFNFLSFLNSHFGWNRTLKELATRDLQEPRFCHSLTASENLQ
jgi:hypothetical protein